LEEVVLSQLFREERLEDIRQFVAARQVTGRPVAIARWQRLEDGLYDGEDFDPDDDWNEDDGLVGATSDALVRSLQASPTSRIIDNCGSMTCSPTGTCLRKHSQHGA
jgi:hypothetical protein